MRRYGGGKDAQLVADDLDRRLRRVEADDGQQSVPTTTPNQPSHGARTWWNEEKRELNISDRGGQWKVPLYAGYTDVLVPATAVRVPAASAPDTASWLTNLSVLAFDDRNPDTGAEYVYVSLQLPHGYKEGTDLYFHVHFAPSGTIADGETVVFSMDYTIANVNSLCPPTTALTCTFTNNASTRDAIRRKDPSALSGTGVVAKTHLIAGGGTIDGSSLEMSSVLYGRLSRATTGTASGDVYLLSADAHALVERWGSRYEYHD